MSLEVAYLDKILSDKTNASSWGSKDGIPWIGINTSSVELFREYILNLEKFRDEAEAVLNGELGSDWANDFGPLYEYLEATK